MRHIIGNSAYFIREIKTIFLIHKTSSILSLLSLVMIFTLVLLAGIGGWMTSSWIDLIKNEAEISLYYKQNLSSYQLEALVDDLESLDGVTEVMWISEDAAYLKMEEILGQEAAVLSNFSDNPFESYFEVGIDFEKRTGIVQALEEIDSINYIRDNRDVLNQLEGINNFIQLITSIVSIAVVVSTFIITSHIIREGIHGNREHIKTLNYLGAPTWFVNFPYIMEGIIITGLSSIIAALGNYVIVYQIGKAFKGTVSFLPALHINDAYFGLAVILVIGSCTLGFLASIFGLRLVREK